MTDEILNEREIEYFISSWKLIPSTGGVFDVTVNGELVFSKHAVGRHAEPGEVRDGILKVLETVRPPDFELVSKQSATSCGFDSQRRSMHRTAPAS